LKVIYVSPIDGIVEGTYVRAGQEIGHSQSLQKAYPPTQFGPMTDHVHFQIEKQPQGRSKDPYLLDPTPVVRRWLAPAGN
jgi:hypothetical protein